MYDSISNRVDMTYIRANKVIRTAWADDINVLNIDIRAHLYNSSRQ